MLRYVLALDLKDDPELIRQYREWHRPGGPPAAITRSIKVSGILALEIFLVGNRMVMIIEAGDDFSFAAKSAADAADANVQAWEELMWRFQQALPGSRPGEKWLPMERIFALSEQPDT